MAGFACHPGHSPGAIVLVAGAGGRSGIARAPEKWASTINLGCRHCLYGSGNAIYLVVRKVKTRPRSDGEAPLGAVTDDELKTWMEEGQT